MNRLERQRDVLRRRADAILAAAEPRRRRVQGKSKRCAVCGAPERGIVVTRGQNANGSLLVFRFCSAAHIDRWRSEQVWP